MKIIAVKTPGDACPRDPEDTFEQLYLRRLDARSSLQFRVHVERCPACQGIYAGTGEYIESIRLACAMLAGSELRRSPIRLSH